jgi:hypothetical protein
VAVVITENKTKRERGYYLSIGLLGSMTMEEAEEIARRKREG